MNKFILDACCGWRMFWFNKQHPNVLYIDKRKEPKWFVEARPNFDVNPDEVMDFCDIKYPDKTFKLVVFDPPHISTLWKNSWMSKKYGRLRPWRERELKNGFDECWRVLDDYGTLIFKRNESEIPIGKVLKLFWQQPLFWHKSGKSSKTHRMCFMKIPE